MESDEYLKFYKLNVTAKMEEQIYQVVLKRSSPKHATKKYSFLVHDLKTDYSFMVVRFVF
jgi:hypothetical protein